MKATRERALIKSGRQSWVVRLVTATFLTATSVVQAVDQPIRIPLLLMRARTAVAALPEMNDRAWALCRIARVQAADGDLKGGLTTIESIRQLRLESKNDPVIIRGMGLAEIAGVEVRLGNVQSAYALAKRVDDDLMRSEIYASIASAQTEIGDLDGASQTLKRVSGADDHFMPVRAPLVARIAHAYVQRGDLDAAQRILDLDRDNKSSRAMAVKQEAVDEIVAARIKQGLADNMSRSDRDSTNTFRDVVVVTTLADMGRFAEAFAILGSISTPRLRETALAAIAAAQARQGDDSSATQTVSKISGATGQMMGWKAVASAYLNKGDKEKAGRILNQAPGCRHEGNGESLPPEVCGSFAVLFVEIGDLAQAKGAISTITDGAQRRKSLRGIVRRLVLTHDFESARQFADLEPDNASRMRLYKSIAVGLEMSDASEKALEFTRNSIEPAAQDRVKVELAKVRTRRGRVQDALDLVSEINNQQARLDVLIGIAESLLPPRLRQEDIASEADSLEKPQEPE